MDRTLAAAEAVVSARRSGTPLDTLPSAIKPQTVVEGYCVQKAVHERLAQTEWGHIIGYKIGCTTAVMQQYLGISHPCAGGLVARPRARSFRPGASSRRNGLRLGMR